eukprot:351121-Chlamydomonas_euryale.AAC.1
MPLPRSAAGRSCRPGGDKIEYHKRWSNTPCTQGLLKQESLNENLSRGGCYKCNNTWPRGLLRLTCIASNVYEGAHSASPQRLSVDRRRRGPSPPAGPCPAARPAQRARTDLTSHAASGALTGTEATWPCARRGPPDAAREPSGAPV